MACTSCEERTGRLIYLCLEPEPGCVFSFADDAVHFFQWQLLGREDDEIVRRHIRICHDICHAAVMFEDQEEVLRKYAAAGIEVGKVQVSAALRMDLDLFEPPAAEPRAEALKQLAQFAEDRYLHQTVVRRGGEDVFYEDLQLALDAEARRSARRVAGPLPRADLPQRVRPAALDAGADRPVPARPCAGTRPASTSKSKPTPGASCRRS